MIGMMVNSAMKQSNDAWKKAGCTSLAGSITPKLRIDELYKEVINITTMK